MGHSYLLQENGDQIQLEQQSNSFLILETDDDVGIHLVGQPHPTQAFYTGPKAEQLIPIEFIFKIKSCLITKTKVRICTKSALRLPVKTSSKLKSVLLSEVKSPYKMKSTLLMVKENVKLFLTSTLIVKENYKIGLFANVMDKTLRKKLSKKYKTNKIKEFLLRRLKDMLDDG